jgi:hypothetical protein
VLLVTGWTRTERSQETRQQLRLIYNMLQRALHLPWIAGAGAYLRRYDRHCPRFGLQSTRTSTCTLTSELREPTNFESRLLKFERRFSGQLYEAMATDGAYMILVK